MSIINGFLEYIQIEDLSNKNKENLNEFFLPIIISILRKMMEARLIKDTKIDKELTTKFNKLMRQIAPDDNKKDWVIRVLKDEVPNAMTFGGKEIYITSTLLSLLTSRETEAVLLHEVGHVIHLDLLYAAVSQSAFGLIGTLITIYLLKELDSDDPRVAITLILFFLMLAPSTITTILLSKKAEYRADSYAGKLGYSRELISALRKLDKEFLNYAKKHKIPIQKERNCKTLICTYIDKLSRILDSHPSTKERLENLAPYIKQKLAFISAKLALR